MRESVKRWLLLGNLTTLIIAVAGLIYLSLITYTSIIGDYQTISLIVLILAGLNLIIMFSIRYHDRKWLKRLSKISVYLLPVVSIGFYFLFDFFDSSATWIGIFLVCLIIVLILLALIYGFILREAGDINGILVLLIFTVISVVMQRFDFSLSAVEDLFLPGFVVLTAAGMYMFGLRCLFIVEKNRYLKSVAFIACTLTTFGSFLFFLKMQGETIDILELVYIVPALLVTLVVLLSLPISGYIHWNSIHKRILRKIALTSLFFLLIFSFRFLYPDFFKQIVFKQTVESPEYWLEDYKIPDKNGLETD